MFSGDFTLAKDEDFGDYYCDLSEKSNRILRATVKTYEHTGTYVFLKLFKKKPDAEFALARKKSLKFYCGKENQLFNSRTSKTLQKMQKN